MENNNLEILNSIISKHGIVGITIAYRNGTFDTCDKCVLVDPKVGPGGSRCTMGMWGDALGSWCRAIDMATVGDGLRLEFMGNFDGDTVGFKGAITVYLDVTRAHS
jgi:hypothetical protein